MLCTVQAEWQALECKEFAPTVGHRESMKWIQLGKLCNRVLVLEHLNHLTIIWRNQFVAGNPDGRNWGEKAEGNDDGCTEEW